VRANPRVGALSRPGTDGTTALPCRGGPVRPRSAAHPCAAPRRSNVRSNTGTCSDGKHRTLARDAITQPSTTHIPALRSTVYRSAPQRPPLRCTRHLVPAQADVVVTLKGFASWPQAAAVTAQFLTDTSTQGCVKGGGQFPLAITAPANTFPALRSWSQTCRRQTGHGPHKQSN
jgi:hypothetical protein